MLTSENRGRVWGHTQVRDSRTFAYWNNGPLHGAPEPAHPLDDQRSFMETSQTPFPFDQPCLVAPVSVVGFTQCRIPRTNAPQSRYHSTTMNSMSLDLTKGWSGPHRLGTSA